MLEENKNYIDDYKTEQFFLYILKKTKDTPNIGATVLNKILYFSDSIHYLKYGKQISKMEYRKQDYGATPNGHYIPFRERLISEGKVTSKKKEYFGFIQNRLITDVEPDISEFTSTEIELIDEMINLFQDSNATGASELSHSVLAWQIARDMEELPINSILLTKSQPSLYDIEWAKSKITEHRVMFNN